MHHVESTTTIAQEVASPAESTCSLGLKLSEVLKTCLCALITIYRWCISPLLGPCCRFYPSCSEYAFECLKKYPLFQALKKTGGRLLHCHPFHPGGVDLP